MFIFRTVKRKREIFAVLLFFICIPAYSVDLPLNFRRISIQHGLSQNTVIDVTQDTNGYIWIGTEDGLNKYDSYDFTVYRHQEGDPATIAGNKITSVDMDSDGVLWVGTTRGLSRYNSDTDDFSNFPYKDEDIQIYDIEESADGNLVLTTQVGLLTFDRHAEEFRLENGRTELTALCRYGNDMLVGSKSGLYLYSAARKDLTAIVPEMGGSNICDIDYIQGEGCWIATFGDGIFRLDDNLEVTAHLCRATSASKGLLSDNIRVVTTDYEGRLWIGSIDGLFIYYPKQNVFERYSYIPDDITSIGHNSIRSIFMDSQRGIWIGSFYGGLSYYHPQLSRFVNLRYHTGENALNDNNVTYIARDGSSSDLWVGTNDRGLSYYDSERKVFRNLSDIGLLSNNVKCIYPDPSGEIYIGTHAGGLSCLDRQSMRVRNYTINPESMLFNSCYSILDEGNGTLMLGALNGLYLFEKRTGKILPHPLLAEIPQLNGEDVYYLMKDSEGQLWICTNRGLYSYDYATGNAGVYETVRTGDGAVMTNVRMLTIAEASTGTLWIGSDHGLLEFDKESGTFRHYQVRDGLANDVVNGILEDFFNRLWLSTNKGITCFDPADKSFKNYNPLIWSDNCQFMPCASCMDKNGLMYFGSVNGIIYFNPADLTDNPYSPQPMITGITVFNRETTEDDDVVFTKSNGVDTSVRFPSKNSVFSIKYTVINPISNSSNRFSYTLKNFDDYWYETDKREVSYSNLPPGKYVFMVKSCNNDGVWSRDITSFPIHITPMWYQTLSFRILLAAIIVWIVILVIRSYVEHADKKRIYALSQEKIRFYINLSHELKTPLTLILSPVEELKRCNIENRYIATRIDMIRRNTSRLLYMVNQMLEFRKAETGMLKLRIEVADVDEIAAGIFSLFEPVALDRNIDYILKSGTGPMLLPIDRMFMERILSNLLSNAFKFVPDNGMIKVSISCDDRILTLSVKDNGPGIPKEKQEKIFERFYKADESASGTGIGLSFVRNLVELHHGKIRVQSNEGEGCEFIVTLPARLKDYSETEMAGKDAAYKEPVHRQTDYIKYLEDTMEKDSEPDIQDQEEAAEGKTVMIVEDNGDIRKYLAEAFSGQYNVLTAANGKEALNLLNKEVPDIIITDLMMPVMDGLQLLHSIKSNLKTSHIPVIVLTAKDSLDDQLKGMETGADDYLSKPFSIELLKAKMDNIFKAHKRLLSHYYATVDFEPEQLTQNTVDADFLTRAAEIVDKNLTNENFSIEDLSSELCVSRSTLHLKMKAITGDSPSAFVRKMRLTKACKLLVEHKYSVTEISEMVGFSSPSYFATLFRKHVGCMPSDYVKLKA